jgi:outer membrane protein assembly factor BamB
VLARTLRARLGTVLGMVLPAFFAVAGLRTEIGLIRGMNGWLTCAGCIGDALRPAYAIRPGASGDTSLKTRETSNAAIAWSSPTGAPYNPTPLVVGDLYYTLFDSGFFTAHEARTGKEVYPRQRITGDASGFTASPWAYNGKVFAMSENGDTYVIQGGAEFKVVGKNSLMTKRAG